MAQLAERLGLDLANALASDPEVLPDLFQRVLAAVGEAEAKTQHLLLARRERVEDLVRLLAQRQPDDGVDGRHDLLVLDEIAEVAVFLFSDRRSEEHTSELQSPCNLVCRLLLAKKKHHAVRRTVDQ